MLQLGGIAIDAISTGGLETCIQLPGLGLAFDIGRCPFPAVARPTVAFTHSHVDHLGGAIFHCATRGLLDLDPPRYLMPASEVEAFNDLFKAWRRLDRSDLPYTIQGLEPGDTVSLGRDLALRPFRSIHRVPCLGYGLWRTTRRLKAELVGRPGTEIRDLRLAGAEVTDAHEEPILAFTGDSLIEVIEREEVTRRAKVLVMEVTFLDERVSVEATRAKGHIHLDEVIERAELFENEAILFTHLSARYSVAEGLRILEERLPEGLKERVTLLPLSGSDGRV